VHAGAVIKRAMEANDFYAVNMVVYARKRTNNAARAGGVNPPAGPRLEHDPEKWLPVFRKDHAPPKI
jgi:hypothetical protein